MVEEGKVEEQEGAEPTDKMVGGEDSISVNDAVAGLADSLKLTDTPIEGKEAEGEQPKEGEVEKPAAETKPVEGAEPAAKPAEPAPTDIAPDTWRKEAKEKWAMVDPVVKAEIAKREGDIAKYVGEVGPSLNVAKNMEKVLAPYAETLQKYNINPWDEVNNLLQ